jgi:SSS family solute:Na+ symporter
VTTLLIIAGYLTVLLGLGAVSNRLLRGTSRDYLLASQTIGPVLLLLSLFGTTMTAFALVGSTGEAYKEGVRVYANLASASGIVHSLCFFLIGVRLWKLGRQHGFTTQIQFFRQRLESDFIGLLLFPVLVGLVVVYLLIGVISSGVLIQLASRDAFQPWGWFASHQHALPNWLGSLLVCLVVLAYVFFGGMRGTAWANALQTLFFMSMGVVTFIAVARHIGGEDSLWQSMQAASQRVDHAHRSRAGLPWGHAFSYLLIPLSVAMFPHVFQHWLTARNARAFRLPIVLHPVFILIVWLPCVLLGTWASAYFTAPVEPNSVLARLVQRLESPVLSGLLTAGILAAIMSSLDSQFLCVGTMFTHDVLLHYAGRRRLSDRQRVVAARAFVVAVVGLTYALSLLHPGEVFHIGVWSFSGFAGLFPLVLAACYWRRLTRWGAMASIVAAAASWWYFFTRVDPSPAAHAALAAGLVPLSAPAIASGLTSGIAPAGLQLAVSALPLPAPWFQPVVPIVAISGAALVLVSLATRPPSAATLARFFGEVRS